MIVMGTIYLSSALVWWYLPRGGCTAGSRLQCGRSSGYRNTERVANSHARPAGRNGYEWAAEAQKTSDRLWLINYFKVNYLWRAEPALRRVGLGGSWTGQGHWFNSSSRSRDVCKLHTLNTLLKVGLIIVLPSSALSANDSNSPCRPRTRTNHSAMTRTASLKT